MRKGMLLGFGVLLIGVFILVGCGQQNPTINTANPQPQGLKLKGVVRTTTLNSTAGAPLAGAYVTLSGDSANHTVLTNSSGEYLIENVPDGSYNLIVTAEGHTRNSTTAVAVAIKPSSAIPADNTITVTDIQLASRPIIFSYSPVPTSVITANQTFVVSFNEAMDTSTVAPTLTAAGIRTMVLPSAGNVAITTTWDTAGKVLTIVPKAALISNESYTLTINTGAAGATDAAGYPLSTAAELANAASATYRVGTGTGLPGDPTNLAIVYNTTTECDYTRVYGATTLYLSWTSPTTGGPITGYNVYVAYGAGGNFSLVAGSPVVSNQFTLTSTLILNALYGTGATRDPVCSGGYPFINDALRIKVVAVNGDGESATGSTISARDTLGPQLDAADWTTFSITGQTIVNNVWLPKLAANEAYVTFTEPIASVGALSTYHLGTYEATGAALITTSAVADGTGAFTAARSVVKVTIVGNTLGKAVTLEAGAATDLSGNASPANAVGTVVF